jgi:hypothetical protein
LFRRGSPPGFSSETITFSEAGGSFLAAAFPRLRMNHNFHAGPELHARSFPKPSAYHCFDVGSEVRVYELQNSPPARMVSDPINDLLYGKGLGPKKP